MSGGDGFAPRSLLFVPGNRPDMVAKVGRARPDAVALDLEDAVAPGDKDTARDTVVATLTGERPGAGTVLVRVNAPGTPWQAADLDAVAGLVAGGRAGGVVLPKYADPARLVAVRDALGPEARVVVGLEDALGIADSRELLAAGPDAAYFGAEDYAVSVGARRTRSGAEVLHARSRVVLHAALAGVPVLDQAVTAVRDRAAFRGDAEQGADLGFQGKICLHPVQVELAHEVFTPSADEVAHARRVLAAGGSGVGTVDGEMVDAVHLAAARAVLVRAAAR